MIRYIFGGGLRKQLHSTTSGMPEQGEGSKQTTNTYSTDYAEFVSAGKGLESAARVRSDGRISVKFDLKKGASDILHDYAVPVEEFAIDSQWKDCPKMNIVIMIVGSRGMNRNLFSFPFPFHPSQGDVQPYVALAQQLEKDGHRVRIATHETFRDFVHTCGLEFFSIGGNPQDLMSYMVKSAHSAKKSL